MANFPQPTLNPAGSTSFSPGFRISVLDVVILIAGTASAIILGLQTWSFGLVIAFVVGHFFLFCNVFRMSRRLELIWGLIFTLLAGATIRDDFPGWGIAITVSVCTTVVLIAIEMQRPLYHGICWEKINPGLKQRWDAQAGK